MFPPSDVSLSWVISVSATALLLTYFWLSRRNPKYPPCPLRPWPIVGNLLQLDPDPREQFAGFRKQCGDIYSLYLGPKHTVILNGLDVAKEAFIKQGDDFSDRAQIFLDVITDGVNKGLFASNGDIWKENRHFYTSVMRKFGLRNNILAEKVQVEVIKFIELIASFREESTEIHTFTAVSVSNILCSIVAGHTYEYGDREFQRLLEIMTFNLSKLQGTAILNYFPLLRFLPADIFSCKIMHKNCREFYDIFARVHMQEKENDFSEPDNLISAYLREMNMKEKANEKTYLDKPNLSRLILDLFLAGTETVTSTLLWFFLYMMNYPGVQEKIFQELRDVVGLDRTPTIQDKDRLIHLSATIMEVQRLASFLPLSTVRVVSRDVNLQGYLIPKGTEILLNFDSILHDRKLWGDHSDKFLPERFISPDGSLISPEAWIVFSIGRRVCIGKALAKLELFLFLSNILQRFLIVAPDTENIPPIKGHLGLTHSPLPFEIRFVNRAASK